ncbi:DUF488 domain-containing protein [Nocardioides sp. SYSU DS0651]|uniref:DUF488 domain-containing protein n=1 Tax=Nocardioides sp. SYSU DS0651 TaxID=3415955 RepID=UPI003F4B229A
MAHSTGLEQRTAWTVGHWSCPQSVVVDRLLAHDIDLLVDVRAQPGSRRNPHFDQERMPGWLADAGIGYRHLPDLAGRRRRQDVDPALNAGWRNQSFHNYADYALGPAYRRGIAELEALGTRHRVAVMCGEPMPWRCHRLLIANTLAARGWTVWHLMGDGSSRRHELGRWGSTPRVGPHGELTYPAEPEPGDDR